MRQINYEWALEGKPPGSHDDYEILSCSQLSLDFRIFAENATRYATGTPADLPQVTVAFAQVKGRSGDVLRYLVLAGQDWSDHRDGTGRRVSHTRWFYVPYAQLREHPVGYEDLYAAIEHVSLPPVEAAPPYAVSVPAFRPEALAAGETEKRAAALLLTGQPVCVVGAEGVPMRDRLRFLDTVAALLPYGMRTRLTASTWTSSTSHHRIKLSFARHAPEGAHQVTWHGEGLIPAQERLARSYLGLLDDLPLADVMSWLARRTAPLTFGAEDRVEALALLQECADDVAAPPTASPAVPPSLQKVLGALPREESGTRWLPHLPGVSSPPTSRLHDGDLLSPSDEAPKIRGSRATTSLTMAQLILVLRDARDKIEVDEIVHEMQMRAGTHPSDRDVLRRNLAESDSIPQKLDAFKDPDWVDTRLEQLTQAAFPDEDLRSPDVLERSACLAAQPGTPPVVVITLSQHAMRTPGNLPMRWTRIRDQNLRKHHRRRDWTRFGAFAAATVGVIVVGVMIGSLIGGDIARVTSKPAVTKSTPGPPVTIRLFQQRGSLSLGLSAKIEPALRNDNWDPQPDAGPLTKALESTDPRLVIAYDLDALASLGHVPTDMDSTELSGELKRRLADRGFAVIPVSTSVSEDRLLLKKSAGIKDIPAAARDNRLKIAAWEGYDEGLIKSFGKIFNRQEIPASTPDGNWDALIVPSDVADDLNVDDYTNIDLPLPKKTLTVLTNVGQAQRSRIEEAVKRATGQPGPTTESATEPTGIASDSATSADNETGGMSETLVLILWALVAVAFFIFLVVVYVHYHNRPIRR